MTVKGSKTIFRDSIKSLYSFPRDWEESVTYKKNNNIFIIYVH